MPEDQIQLNPISLLPPYCCTRLTKAKGSCWRYVCIISHSVTSSTPPSCLWPAERSAPMVALSPVLRAQRRGQRYRAGGGAPKPILGPLLVLMEFHVHREPTGPTPKPHVSDHRCGWRRAGTGSMLHPRNSMYEASIQFTNKSTLEFLWRSRVEALLSKPSCRRRDRRDTFLVAPVHFSRLQQAERQAGEGVAAEQCRSLACQAPKKMVPGRLATG